MRRTTKSKTVKTFVATEHWHSQTGGTHASGEPCYLLIESQMLDEEFYTLFILQLRVLKIVRLGTDVHLP